VISEFITIGCKVIFYIFIFMLKNQSLSSSHYKFVILLCFFVFILRLHYVAFTDTRVPYSCTGQFQTDFAELCRRVDPPFVHTPDVVLRPHRPQSPTLMPIIEERTTKTGKSIKKEEKHHPGVEQEKTDTPVSMEKGGCIL